MKCKYCGSTIESSNNRCEFCGKPVPGRRQEKESYKEGNTYNDYETSLPVNATPYIIWAAINTLLCCLPAGVIGLSYAVKAKKPGESGPDCIAKARMWNIVGSLLGVIFLIVFLMIPTE